MFKESTMNFDCDIQTTTSAVINTICQEIETGSFIVEEHNLHQAGQYRIWIDKKDTLPCFLVYVTALYPEASLEFMTTSNDGENIQIKGTTKEMEKLGRIVMKAAQPFYRKPVHKVWKFLKDRADKLK